MRSYLFKIGSFEIRIYSLMYIIALLLAIHLAKRDEVASKKGINNAKDIEDLAYVALFSGLIGARLYYVLLNFDYYSKNIFEILAVYKGGLAIHGGIIGGFIGVYIFAKKRKYKLANLTDMAVGPLILGQAIGRIGNFANGEIHGVPTFTPLKVIFTGTFNKWWEYYNSLPILEQAKYKNIVPWGVVFPQDTPAGIDFPSYPLHPAMLYEMILNLICFILIWFVFRKKGYRSGVLSMIYLIMYAIIRIFVSTFRVEDLMIYGIRAPYIISIIMIIFGIFGIWKINTKKQ